MGRSTVCSGSATVGTTSRSTQSALRSSALGHAKGESLPFRPKPGMYAMMFLTDNGEFWSHITPEEFRLICEAAR